MAFSRLLQLEGHASPILCCSSPAAENVIASGSEEGRVCLHDMNEARLAQTVALGGEDDAVSSIAFHPANPYQLYAAVASEVKLIDLRSGPSIASTFTHNKDEVNQIAINSRGTHLAAADDAGDVQVLDLASGRLFKSIQGAHSNIASSVSFRSHRPWELVTAGFDQTVARWDFSRGKCLTRVRMEVETNAEGESQLLNPPMVHALAVPSTSARPWCQVVAAARGDGVVEVFDADAQPSSSSSSSSTSALSRAAKQGKGKGIAAAQGPARTGGSSRGGEEGEHVPRNRPWCGSLLLDRARGGHTRPATAVAFLWRAQAGSSSSSNSGGCGGDGQPHSASGPSADVSSACLQLGSSSKGSPSVKHGRNGGVAAGAPTHLLSASEDKRLLLWRLPQLGQGQGGGTEWLPRDGDEGSVQGERSGEEGHGEAMQGSSFGGGQCVVAEHMHGRKVNCVYVPQEQYRDLPQPQMVFIGDTSKRLSCYACQLCPQLS